MTRSAMSDLVMVFFSLSLLLPYRGLGPCNKRPYDANGSKAKAQNRMLNVYTAISNNMVNARN